MNREFRTLRQKQLERNIQTYSRAATRPQRGWIRAIRQATGLTLNQLAKRLHRSTSVIAHLERSEADYRITLGNLRDSADALGCRLVYAFVPKSGTLHQLIEDAVRAEAEANVRAVEHSMALEAQAVGDLDEKIQEETRRIVSRRQRQ